MEVYLSPLKEVIQNNNCSDSQLNLTSSGNVINMSSIDKNTMGAAFSLANLDQSSRGSTMNFSNLGFDTAVFLKSGSSFDCLNTLLNSQMFNGNSMFNMDKQLLLTNQNPSGVGSFSSMQLPMLPNNIKTIAPTSICSSVISTSVPSMAPYGNNALIQPKESEKRIIEKKDDSSKFVDVTPFLTLPQHEAAKKLGIPSSTLAKRWKEASCNRKWPYRTVSKLDKEILTLLKNVENAKAELSPSVEATLGLLLKKRQEELKTVLVRL